VRKAYTLGSPFYSKLLANDGAESECDKHTHTVRINTAISVDFEFSGKNVFIYEAKWWILCTSFQHLKDFASYSKKGEHYVDIVVFAYKKRKQIKISMFSILSQMTL